MRISYLLPVLLLTVGCGKKQDESGGAAPSPKATATQGSSAAVVGAVAEPSRGKKPIPADTLLAKVRLVNLYVAPDGKTGAVDVWAIGGMYEPAKLASGVAFGAASDWIATPVGSGMRLILVPEGAPGQAASELGGMSIGAKDRMETTTFYRDAGKPTSGVVGGADDVAKPAAGKGVVLLHAGQLSDFENELKQTPLGGRSFMVGEPGGTCATTVLGGTSSTTHEVAPGTAKLTLHKFPGDCKSPALHTVSVDVAADAGVRVELFTTDGKSLEQVAMPLVLR